MPAGLARSTQSTGIVVIGQPCVVSVLQCVQKETQAVTDLRIE